jgi:hypothetical protein
MIGRINLFIILGGGRITNFDNHPLCREPKLRPPVYETEMFSNSTTTSSSQFVLHKLIRHSNLAVSFLRAELGFHRKRCISFSGPNF